MFACWDKEGTGALGRTVHGKRSEVQLDRIFRLPSIDRVASLQSWTIETN